MAGWNAIADAHDTVQPGVLAAAGIVGGNVRDLPFPCGNGRSPATTTADKTANDRTHLAGDKGLVPPRKAVPLSEQRRAKVTRSLRYRRRVPRVRESELAMTVKSVHRRGALGQPHAGT